MRHWHMSDVLEGGSRRWLHTWSNRMGGGGDFAVAFYECASPNIKTYQNYPIFEFTPIANIFLWNESNLSYFRPSGVRSEVHYMARFHMSEEGILGDKDLMTLCAVMNLADPVATTGAACGTSAPVVVSPAPADPLTSFPVMGSDWDMPSSLQIKSWNMLQMTSEKFQIWRDTLPNLHFNPLNSKGRIKKRPRGTTEHIPKISTWVAFESSSFPMAGKMTNSFLMLIQKLPVNSLVTNSTKV